MDANKSMKLKHFSHKNGKKKKHYMYYFLASLLLIGITYQQLSTYYAASSFGRMGQLVDIDGTKMHLYETGDSDIPIVFAANIGATVPYAETYPLHSKLSEEHQVLVYDKPGYGWSDITSENRDIDTICSEIHTLLHKNEIPDDEDTHLKPFIYVAYGMGSLEALRYAQLYPEDLAGIVLIEGASPEFAMKFNNIMIVESFLSNGLRNTGLLRLFVDTDLISSTLGINPELPEDLQALSRGLSLEKLWNNDILSEKLKVNSSGEVIKEGGTLGDIPLRVITSQKNEYSNWNKTQREMLELSTDSDQAYIEGSANYIEETDVPLILEEINKLITHIEELREEG